MGNATVIFNLRDGTIEVRGPTDDLTTLFKAVRDAAPALKDIRVIASTDDEPEAPKPSRSPTSGMAYFALNHHVSTASERIALLGFFATRMRGRDHFSADEMETWFRICAFKMPASMSYAMADAQRKDGYIENQGRNQWVLTPKGEKLIAQLVEGSDESP